MIIELLLIIISFIMSCFKESLIIFAGIIIIDSFFILSLYLITLNRLKVAFYKYKS